MAVCELFPKCLLIFKASKPGYYRTSASQCLPSLPATCTCCHLRSKQRFAGSRRVWETSTSCANPLPVRRHVHFTTHSLRYGSVSPVLLSCPNSRDRLPMWNTPTLGEQLTLNTWRHFQHLPIDLGPAETRVSIPFCMM